MLVGTAIIIAWLAGIALLVHREYFRPQVERLAEAAMRISPGAVYYGVMQGTRQIGFASSTIDTAQASITVNDYFVADIPIGGKARRATARTNVTLSRALRLKNFDLALDTESGPVRARGLVEGDSVLLLNISSGNDTGRTSRIPIDGPILLPTLVPLAVALGEKPKVGKHYTLPVFDPSTMAPKNVELEVRAESLFIVNDSSVYDSTSKRWRGIQPDSIHAWQITSSSNGGFSGWIDEQGRIVETTQLGFALRRLPYEVAFENWRADSNHTMVSDDRDILETTAIAANKKLDRNVESLTARLTGADLSGFDISGQRQRFSNGTLTITQIPPEAFTSKYLVGQRPPVDSKYTSPEPLIQSDDPQIRRLALRIEGPHRDPRLVAEQINAWVYDSIRPRVTFGIPSALEVLDKRVGDCNEHTQLYVALARAIGLPARIASGLAYVGGKFYYHAWPEVYLGDWVPVDPTFGQFPADAAHLRLIVGGLGRQAELLRVMGNLQIKVLMANSRPTP
ncbi:MAG TPA: transglutaminase-like domain-containing protein [Gemmatimonadaceae bacterium]|nr:transglutaminase-like domain-containing protein [Gemmatimonadaceae bacterium]